jgi:hypothetical protein
MRIDHRLSLLGCPLPVIIRCLADSLILVPEFRKLGSAVFAQFALKACFVTCDVSKARQYKLGSSLNFDSHFWYIACATNLPVEYLTFDI